MCHGNRGRVRLAEIEVSGEGVLFVQVDFICVLPTVTASTLVFFVICTVMSPP